MKAWLLARGPVLKGFLGAVLGVITVAAVVHFVTLYISVLRVIAFINQYAEKIAKLP